MNHAKRVGQGEGAVSRAGRGSGCPGLGIPAVRVHHNGLDPGGVRAAVTTSLGDCWGRSRTVEPFPGAPDVER